MSITVAAQFRIHTGFQLILLLSAVSLTRNAYATCSAFSSVYPQLLAYQSGDYQEQDKYTEDDAVVGEVFEIIARYIAQQP